MDTNTELRTLADVLGTLGGLSIVGAYLGLQLERLDSRSLAYSLLNALGAGMILFSLVFDFNLGATLVEAFWLLVSLFGIAKALRRRPEPGAEVAGGSPTEHRESPGLRESGESRKR